MELDQYLNPPIRESDRLTVTVSFPAGQVHVRVNVYRGDVDSVAFAGSYGVRHPDDPRRLDTVANDVCFAVARCFPGAELF
jgi:hypothetical protein